MQYNIQQIMSFVRNNLSSPTIFMFRSEMNVLFYRSFFFSHLVGVVRFPHLPSWSDYYIHRFHNKLSLQTQDIITYSSPVNLIMKSREFPTRGRSQDSHMTILPLSLACFYKTGFHVYFILLEHVINTGQAVLSHLNKKEDPEKAEIIAGPQEERSAPRETTSPFHTSQRQPLPSGPLGRLGWHHGIASQRILMLLTR